MRNYLIFGGRDSRDFGVYISGQETFSAPARAYQFNAIAGRNGALIGNERRLENIEVSYECFICTNFSENLANFRTYLLSCIGYQELTDSYHQDEYRLACYTGPLEPQVTRKNDAGTFTLTFNCKPQRFLTSGKATYYYAPGYPQYVEGKSISVDSDLADRTYLKSIINNGNQGTYGALSLYINGVRAGQTVSLTGGPIRYGEVDWIAGVASVITKVVSFNRTISWRRVSATQYAADISPYIGAVGGANCEERSRDAQIQSFFEDGYVYSQSPAEIIFTTRQSYASEEDFHTALYAAVTGMISFVFYVDYLNPVTRTFSPYIPDYSGQITVETYMNGIPATSLSTDLTTRMKYALVEDLENPTEFPSEPLLRVYGAGSLEMDGVTITISTCDTYTDIDCELMDCYEGSTNRNNSVSFSTYDFPKLQPGKNSVTVNTGITSIELIPRWWRV